MSKSPVSKSTQSFIIAVTIVAKMIIIVMYRLYKLILTRVTEQCKHMRDEAVEMIFLGHCSMYR